MTTTCTPISRATREILDALSLEEAVKTPDVSVAPWTFSDTKMTVEAVSPAAVSLFAEMFGIGCVSVDMPLSAGQDFETFCQRKGLKIAA